MQKEGWIPVEGWIISGRRIDEVLLKDEWIPVEGWMNWN